ncbi:hypothetical protein L810_1831 [Burkholderia sp. AU4i]|nr:hypothetical protein L810_1831 [Burkholderia sp. AU4i]MDW9234060.1 hypothetical protein [Burkholderia cepacia]QOH36159.1 hypothetical protein C7S14_7923 [Burkholderia cepacia]
MRGACPGRVRSSSDESPELPSAARRILSDWTGFRRSK